PTLVSAPLSANQYQLASNLTFPPWQPSHSLVSLNNQFQNEILYMFPCVPSFSHLSLIEHPNKENYIAVCSSCTSAAECHNAPTLAPIPDALANVPMFYRRWLSPMHLSCSLGRAESANYFTHYCHLTGAFDLSKNIRAIQIYTRTLGAILDSAPNNNWFHPSLLYAANC
ncbi:36498_t:CDS:2, partial [Gigaspora margarita]